MIKAMPIEKQNMILGINLSYSILRANAKRQTSGCFLMIFLVLCWTLKSIETG
jgi:hypothetical protein